MGRDGPEAGISNLGMILSMAGFLVVLLIVAIIVSLTLPKNDTTTTTSTTTSRASTVPANPAGATTTTASASGTGAATEVAACRSDVTDVQTALAAYQATNGSYPTPPAGWTAASYPADFGPLTNAAPPGPPSSRCRRATTTT